MTKPLRVPQPEPALRHRYVLAFGSNRRDGRCGSPQQIVEAAVKELGVTILAKSKTILTRPIGPGRRTYANLAIVAESALVPDVLLDRAKALEREFGRRKGQKWGDRVIDIDLILWTGGLWSSCALSIPHPAFRERRFVLGPASAIAPKWRDPVTGFSLQQLKARLDRKRPRP